MTTTAAAPAFSLVCSPASAVYRRVLTGPVTIDAQTYNGVTQNELADAVTGDITVDNASFPSGDQLFVSGFQIIEGIHFNGVDGDTTATAVALATALDAIPGISATVDGDVVTVSLRVKQLGSEAFRVRNRKDPGNFSLSPADGYLSNQALVLPPVLV